MIELSSRLIEADVLGVLSKASAEDNLLYLNGDKLDRKLYVDTNKVIEGMGGKWKGGKVQAHVFDAGTDVAGLLEIVLEHGKVPEKNPLAFFRSTQPVVEMVETYMKSGYATALEPSCGDGALLPALRHNGHEAFITAVEVDSARAKKAKSLGIADEVVNEDFLAWSKGRTPCYQAIAMNPPFSAKGNATVYVDHIESAYSLLASGGRLIAIAPAGLKYNTTKKVAALRALIESLGEDILDIPENAFHESGTGVSTVLVIMDKP